MKGQNFTTTTHRPSTKIFLLLHEIFLQLHHLLTSFRGFCGLEIICYRRGRLLRVQLIRGIDSSHIEWFVVGFSFKNVCQRDLSRSVGSGALQISGLFDIVAPTSRLLWEHIALKRSTSCGLVGFSPRLCSKTVGCGLLHIQSAEATSKFCESVSHSAHL